ncbi:hypothetical protein CKA32_004368 [Geitlerinema sp. FC II]|nr:hypothetical protein CKA32_004368 [Geitlerinema sp. FC II]
MACFLSESGEFGIWEHCRRDIDCEAGECVALLFEGLR